MIRENDEIMNSEEKMSLNIFDKKSKKYKIKNLMHLTNDTGETRHYTPAAQE
jgi:hypothetical protein